MDGSAYCRNEVSRLVRLAGEATTHKVKEVLLQQARQYEAAALEIELLSQQQEIERLTG